MGGSFRKRSARQIFAVLVGGYLRLGPTVHASAGSFCRKRIKIAHNDVSSHQESEMLDPTESSLIVLSTRASKFSNWPNRLLLDARKTSVNLSSQLEHWFAYSQFLIVWWASNLVVSDSWMTIQWASDFNISTRFTRVTVYRAKNYTIPSDGI